MTELEFLKQKKYMLKSTKYIRYQLGDVELKFFKNSDEVILSIGEYSAPLNEFLAPFYDKNFPFSEKKVVCEDTSASITCDYCDGKSPDTIEGAADDTDIEEEIQRVLVELKNTDIYSQHYHLHLSTIDRLIGIREKI